MFVTTITNEEVFQGYDYIWNKVVENRPEMKRDNLHNLCCMIDHHGDLVFYTCNRKNTIEFWFKNISNDKITTKNNFKELKSKHEHYFFTESDFDDMLSYIVLERF